MQTSVTLRAEPESAGAARRHLAGFARRAGFRLGDAAPAILTELVANAVRHGREPIEVRISCRDRTLRIEVHDGAATAEEVVVAEHVPGGREHGMGLVVVDALTDAWGAHADPGGGKTVWAELRARCARIRPVGALG